MGDPLPATRVDPSDTAMQLPQPLYIAAARAKAGDNNSALQIIAKLRQSHPSFSLKEVARVFHYADPKLQEHLMEGLRKAGLPE